MENDQDSRETQPHQEIRTNDPETDKRYQILLPIGQGAFGKVFQARDTKSGEIVALKELDPKPNERDEAFDERVKRIVREAELLSGLSHPGLPAFYKAFRATNQYVYIAMEYVQGKDLASILEDRGPCSTKPKRSFFPIQDVYAIAEQLFRVLEAMHDKRFIHRDIKPENIRRTPEGVVKVLDLGVGKDLAAEAKLTKDGAFVGTLAYCSPEQLTQVHGADERTDLYSAGCVLYEMVTGHLTISEEKSCSSVGALLLKIAHEHSNPFDPERYPSKLVEEMNPLLERLILDLLERDREKRVQSATIALQRLAEAKAAEDKPRSSIPLAPVAAPAPVPMSMSSAPPEVPKNKPPFLLFVGIIAGLVGVIVTLIAFFNPKTDQRIERTGNAIAASMNASAPPVTSSAVLATSSASASISASASVAPVASTEASRPKVLNPEDLPKEDLKQFNIAKDAIEGSKAPCLGASKKTLILLKRRYETFAEAYRLLAECMGRENNIPTQEFFLKQHRALTQATN